MAVRRLMLRSLRLHPDFRSDAVRGLEAAATRKGSILTLTYRLSGDLARLRLPPEGEPARTDELWRSTCFEAFVREPAGQAYVEVNLASSAAWAVYGFDAYREGMRSADVAPPSIESLRQDGVCELRAVLDLAGSGLPLDGPWRVAISTVIEETSGAKSYWALAHPDGKPDFHHPDSFVLDLPAPQDTP